MNVLLIVDRLFLRHERSLIERTVVGMLDEGIGVRILVPESPRSDKRAWTVPIPMTRYADRGLSLMTPIRARSIVRAVAKEEPTTRWDIVHAYGGQALSLAQELASQLDASLVFEFWRAGLASRAQSIARSLPSRFLCLIPDHAIQDDLDMHGVRLPTRVAPWGVPAPLEPKTIFPEGKDRTVLFHSSGRDSSRCAAAFDAAAQIAHDHDNTHIFLNQEACQRAGLWGRAKSAGVLDKLTLVSNIEQQRDLALQADIYINPDTLHEQRSLLLEALGGGLLIIAADEGQSSALVNDKTAVIVQGPGRSLWHETLDRVLGDTEHARSIARGGWAHIKQQRKVSTQIGATIDAYTELLGATIQS